MNAKLFYILFGLRWKCHIDLKSSTMVLAFKILQEGFNFSYFYIEYLVLKVSYVPI